jgi:peptide deformylase
VVGAGHLARCLQHETDHLDGVLFIDRMDRDRRKAAMRAIREADWNGIAPPAVKISPHRMANGYT